MAGGGRREEKAGMQNQKQEPHTKMWGITRATFDKKRQVSERQQVQLAVSFTRTSGALGRLTPQNCHLARRSQARTTQKSLSSARS